MSEVPVAYRVQVVGGPYDGAPGLWWVDDGDHPPPDDIFVGRCPGDGSCGARRCSTRRHVAYWTSVEDVPSRAVRYEKEDDFVRREEREGREPEFEGEARYVMGGLSMLPGRTAEELVPAGAA